MFDYFQLFSFKNLKFLDVNILSQLSSYRNQLSVFSANQTVYWDITSYFSRKKRVMSDFSFKGWILTINKIKVSKVPFSLHRHCLDFLKQDLDMIHLTNVRPLTCRPLFWGIIDIDLLNVSNVCHLLEISLLRCSIVWYKMFQPRQLRGGTYGSRVWAVSCVLLPSFLQYTLSCKICQW